MATKFNRLVINLKAFLRMLLKPLGRWSFKILQQLEPLYIHYLDKYDQQTW